MKVLVTGGAGYIGSHTSLELLNKGHEVVIVDNLINSKEEAVRRIREISGKSVSFYKIDLLDKQALSEVFEKENPEAVIHFAGLKAVSESVNFPILYYHTNILSTINLLNVMKEKNVKTLIFSSSATVYGEPKSVPITEDFPLHATNPYGRTKLMIEQMLTDVAISDPTLSVTFLRYFNPIGAHESGRIGEDPNGKPNNLMPFISQVAVGKLPKLLIYGSDWPTPDGTGVRDYIHVVDLAQGHIKALEKVGQKAGVHIYNLGTGHGASVMELLKTYETANGVTIPYEITKRRPGDIPECYADSTKAQRDLDWHPTKTLEDMCRDSFRWQEQNPEGYK